MLQAAQSQRTLELPMMRTIKIKMTQKMPKTTNRQLRLIVMRKIIQRTVQKAEQTLRLFQVQKIIPLHRLLITIYHHLILQIILQVLHRYLNLSQRITTAISFLLIKISHYSHISDKHKHFQQSLQMVTAATLSGKLNRSSSQFQHRKKTVQRVPLILHGIRKK